MSDAVWYYAQGNKEQGPISAVQIKALIQSGKIKPDDLVWKEGMNDWQAASKAPGLLTAEAPLADAPPSTPGSARGKAPAERPPRIEAPFRASAPAPPPPAPPGSAAPPLALGTVSAPEASTASRAAPRWSLAIEPRKLGRRLGWPLVIFGLLVVMTAKGCDVIGQRYVVRQRAASESAETRFQDDWEREKNALLNQQEELREKKDRTPREETTITELEDKLTKLTEKMNTSREQKRRGAWFELASTARHADADHRLAGYWREGWFLLGSLVLAAGLASVSICGEGAEKWICLVMLAIVVFSLYVVGVAWNGGTLGR